MIKRVVFILVIVLLLGLFYGLGRQIYDSLKVSDRVDEETEYLAELQRKNTELQRKVAEVNSLQFIESQARDRLNLARPNETVIIIPQSEIDKVLGAARQEVQKKVEPYWQGWLKLFIK